MTLTIAAMSAIRFGYGIRPGQEPALSPKALLAAIEAGQKAKLRLPHEGIEARRKAVIEFHGRAADIKDLDKEAKREARKVLRQDLQAEGNRDRHARVAQAALSPHGFYERLVTFWMDHFSVSVSKDRMMHVYTALFEVEVIRPGLSGPFADLLRAATTHPAMLIYLDQTKSMGPNSRQGQRREKGLNENLGRELLELHTMGSLGGYTQADVRNAALVLTGLGVDGKVGKSNYLPRKAEPGPIEVLGKTYGEGKRSIDDVYDLLDDLAALKQTRTHICTKLVVHFISDNPPEAIVKAMVATWASTDGDLMAVYKTMLEHPAAWVNPGEKARQPFDFVVAALRALSVDESVFAMPGKNAPDDDDNAMMAVDPAVAERRKKRAMKIAAANEMADDDEADREMAEPKMAGNADDSKAPRKRNKGRKGRPPLNPVTVGALKRLGQPLWEPPSPEGYEENFDTWVSASQITARIEWARAVAARADKRADPKAILKDVLRDAARDNTIQVVSQAPSRVAGLALVLASPEFNRR